MNIRSSISHFLYNVLARRHQERWDNIYYSLTSPTKFRLLMYLNIYSPAPKDDLVDFLLSIGRFSRRDSCVRVVDRHIDEFVKKGLVVMSIDGDVMLKEKRNLVVGEQPRLWYTVGPGLAIAMIGLGQLWGNLPLMAAGFIFLFYSLAIVISLLVNFSAY
jgi:hypothetical protein